MRTDEKKKSRRDQRVKSRSRGAHSADSDFSAHFFAAIAICQPTTAFCRSNNRDCRKKNKPLVQLEKVAKCEYRT